MMFHVGSGFGASLSPQRIHALGGRFMNAFGEHMLAGYDRKMAQVAACKPKPAARTAPKPAARTAPKPAASRKVVRPMTRADRAARLRAAEESVRASQPADARCVWRGMTTGR
jgi:hypothetical protein